MARAAGTALCTAFLGLFIGHCHRTGLGLFLTRSLGLTAKHHHRKNHNRDRTVRIAYSYRGSGAALRVGHRSVRLRLCLHTQYTRQIGIGLRGCGRLRSVMEFCERAFCQIRRVVNAIHGDLCGFCHAHHLHAVALGRLACATA